MAPSLATAFALLAFLCLHAFPTAGAHSENARFLEKLKIKDLAVSYSYAVDLAGRGGDLAEATAIFSEGFALDATFELTFFPEKPTIVQGLANYLGTVQFLAKARGNYISQHMISTQAVKFECPTKAKMQTYFQAVSKAAADTAEYYNGNYTDTVVKVNGQWKIQKRIVFIFNAIFVDADLITFS